MQATEWELRNLKGIIYKFTNLDNNKIYIGQTINTFQRRYRMNCKNWYIYAANSHFQNALKKKAGHNFTVEILEYNQDLQTLLVLEQHYINKYKSDNRRYGYNKTKGGETVSHLASESRRKEVYQICPKTNEIIEVFCSAKEAEMKLKNLFPHISRMHIGQVARGERNTHIGYIWSFDRKPPKKIKPKGWFCRKRVAQINLQDGSVLQIFDSGRDAVRKLKGKYPKIMAESISAACLNKIKTHLGFGWCFEENLSSYALPKRKTNAKKVGQFDLTHNLIREFGSGREAAQMMNCYPQDISRACSKQLNYCGYIWKFI